MRNHLITDLLHKSHNAPFCNRNVHISVTKWCMWDLWDGSISYIRHEKASDALMAITGFHIRVCWLWKIKAASIRYIPYFKHLPRAQLGFSGLIWAFLDARPYNIAFNYMFTHVIHSNIHSTFLTQYYSWPRQILSLHIRLEWNCPFANGSSKFNWSHGSCALNPTPVLGLLGHATVDILVFLHAKPWIPGGEKLIFTVVIH